MADFTVHDKETAPDGSKKTLEKVDSAFGFIPNMMGALAESPLAVNAYATLVGMMEQLGALAPAERQFLMIAISAENGCEYCVPAHSALAGKSGLSEDEIAAAANGGPVANPRLGALRTLALAMIEKHGRVSDEDVQDFLDAGFDKAQVLEVIVCLAAKTLSNYTNHVADVPLDPQFGG